VRRRLDEVQMKRLYLLRHAKAEVGNPSQDDFDRSLAGRGRRAAESIGSVLAQRSDPPELVLCSPSRRTRETLDAILPVLKPQPQLRFERSLYLADVGTLLERIEELPDAVERAMLIGHNPGMEELAQRLTRSDPARQLASLAEKFPTAALAILTFSGHWSDASDGGRLEAFVRPRDLDAR
jgi:phosphohistidine phosphatase